MKAQFVDTVKEPYLIAETAYNHEGDLRYLYRMIDDIAALKANAIKFHMLLNLESYLTADHPHFPLFRKWMFPREEWNRIIDRCKEKQLEVVALCDDVDSIEYIVREDTPVDAIELHATGLNDYFLLEAAAKYEGQVILGIGGSTLDEIQYAVSLLRQRNKNDILLMYGFQSYPTLYSDINLLKMAKIRDLFDLPVGYADHTAFDDPRNETVSVMGAMMGFHILEKHYTPDYGKERIDYHSAVGADAMKRIKELMKLALTVRGDGHLGMSGPELEYGKTGFMKKAIVSRDAIRQGDKLSLDNLWFKRTKDESTIKQSQLLQLVGLEVTRDIGQNELVDFGSVKKPERS
ncbi:MAG: N-acetylneuraminate synthase family protein [Chloroflexi bacterium]|nr:N-acetylneuraminate synthase family protein [Chloroflexota bacterium]